MNSEQKNIKNVSINDNNSEIDEDGVPVGVIREHIRRSLKNASYGSNYNGEFQRFSEFTNATILNPDILAPPKTVRTMDGLLSGFRDLDRVIGGFRKGEITTIAGLPSSGASTFVQNIVRRIATSASVSGINDNLVEQPRAITAFFSLDSTKRQVADRVMYAEAKLDGHMVATGYMTDSGWSALSTSINRLWDANLFIDDAFDATVDHILRSCSQLKDRYGLNIVVVDRVNSVGTEYNSGKALLGHTMVSLKAIAKELAVPIILTNTVDIERADPQTHRLRIQSLPAAVQVYSDVLAILHRGEYWEMRSIYGDYDDNIPENQKGLEVGDLAIVRQVGGTPDTVRFAFNTRWGRFDNLLWD